MSDGTRVSFHRPPPSLAIFENAFAMVSLLTHKIFFFFKDLFFLEGRLLGIT